MGTRRSLRPAGRVFAALRAPLTPGDAAGSTRAPRRRGGAHGSAAHSLRGGIFEAAQFRLVLGPGSSVFPAQKKKKKKHPLDPLKKCEVPPSGAQIRQPGEP